MKLKKLINYGIALVIISTLASCEKDSPKSPHDPDLDFPDISAGIYVLNQGNYYSGVEGSLTVIDYSCTESLLKVFYGANHRSIGATPQCGIAYGSKIYLGVYESNTIEIINRSDYKSLRQISLSESTNGTQPRSMIATGGKIYISMFDGYVARLDTISMQIEAAVKVGNNPEIMALYNGKLYVPNSDGMSYPGPYGKTASEIDLASFTVTKTFEVPENPTRFMASENGLYLLCMGNYMDVNSKIYKINADYTNEAIDNATIAEVCGDYLCYINDPFYGSGIPDYKKYNLTTGEISEWKIDHPEYANGIYYDKQNEKICIHSLKYYGVEYPSFELPGYIAVYDKDNPHFTEYVCGVGTACIFSKSE